MRETHKSKYTQALPGINRNDDHIQFTHGERCISQIGDGLQQPHRLIADANNAQERGRHTKVWCKNLDRLAENSIRDGYFRRDSKLRQWKEHFNKEVDKLAKAIEQIETDEREIHRTKQYLLDMARVSDMTSEFRRKIPGYDPGDTITNFQLEEKKATALGLSDIEQCSKDLKECERKMEGARASLMSEVEAKAMTLNMHKRSQHAEPILSFPYIPANHPVDQLYHHNTDEEWEGRLDEKLKASVALREEASSLGVQSKALIREHLNRTADAYYRTSKAIQEAVQRDERTQFNLQNLLKTIGEEISSTNQRIASLNDDLHIQDRGKTLQLWRLQTLTYRPGPDHIRDTPARILEEELLNIEKKSSYITETRTNNTILLKKLQEEKNKQTLLLENITKKLFIEKEHCLGLRRSITVEGVPLNDYVTDL